MDVVVSHLIERNENQGLHTPGHFDVPNGINVWDLTSLELSSNKKQLGLIDYGFKCNLIFKGVLITLLYKN